MVWSLQPCGMWWKDEAFTTVGLASFIHVITTIVVGLFGLTKLPACTPRVLVKFLIVVYSYCAKNPALILVLMPQGILPVILVVSCMLLYSYHKSGLQFRLLHISPDLSADSKYIHMEDTPLSEFHEKSYTLINWQVAFICYFKAWAVYKDTECNTWVYEHDLYLTLLWLCLSVTYQQNIWQTVTQVLPLKKLSSF